MTEITYSEAEWDSLNNSYIELEEKVDKLECALGEAEDKIRDLEEKLSNARGVLQGIVGDMRDAIQDLEV